MAVGEVFKLAVLTRSHTVQMVNTLWFGQVNNVPVGDPRAALANEFVGHMITPNVLGSWRQMCGNDHIFEGVTVQRYVAYDAGVFPFSITPPLAGTIAENAGPPFAAVCVTVRTAVGGRSGRGRLYVGGVNRSNTQTGLLSAAFQTTVNNFMSRMSDRYVQAGGLAAQGFEYGVWSRKLGGTPPATDNMGLIRVNGWRVWLNVRALSRRVRPAQ